MSKPIIVVDMDEVLFPLTDSFLPYFNKMQGTNHSTDTMTTYRIQDLTGQPEEEVLGRLKEFLLTPHHNEAQPIAGSVDGIKRLSKKFELVLLTARQSFYRGYSEQFIDKHYPGIFDEVRYTHEPEAPDIEIPKVEICKDLKALALIDDSLSNVTQCAEQGMQGILFGDFTWNKADTLPKGVIRLSNWQKVAEHFGV